MRKWTYLFLAALVLLAGCGMEDEQAKENSELQNEVKEKELPQAEKGIETKNSYPLTGIRTNESVDNRIIGVMVNNHSSARPQTGLSRADIVFEMLAEGPITRFLALYQSDLPEVVGPVRSAREYYFELAQGYQALYVYHGAADFVNDMIKERGIDYLNGSSYDNDGHLFKREAFRQAPHNSYLQLGSVYEVAEESGYQTTENYSALPFLKDDEILDISGEEAKHIKIVYSDNPMEMVEFDYNEETEKYIRFNDGEQTVEFNTGDPIELDNVFIFETAHQVIDDAGRREIDLTSGGNAYLIQKGKVQEVNWANQDGRIIPVKDGYPVGFVPGKTWINVVPTAPGIGQSVTITNE